MSRNSKKINILLWTVQILLALLFVFAGVMKFVLPASVLQQGPIVLPLAFLKFIGVCELLGGLGLVLPGLFRIHRELTPLAAAGLVTIMAGATTITVIGMGVLPAITPFVVGILATVVCLARGGARWQLGRTRTAWSLATQA
jgi:uncharacterized membrane protein YphA (DoxX/SURF4 family)